MAVDLEPIVKKHVTVFNAKRLEKIESLNLKDLLRRKNPYLFAARNTTEVEDLARALVAATLSSSEETLFGQTLEDIAIDVCGEAFSGFKSGIQGVDLEFTRDGRRYIVSIKSGPQWGNSSQVKKMRDDFRSAARVIRQGSGQIEVVAVNGCCYGKTVTDKGDYRKVCGAAFWELVSGESDLYQRLLAILSREASNGFSDALDQAVNDIVEQLTEDWAGEDRTLDWERILDHNSK